jgi:hypothetical protein
MANLDAAWILAAVRIFAILRAQSPWRAAAGPVWPVVAAGFAVMLAPAVLPGAQVTASLTISALLTEALLGTALGIVVALPGWALLGASAASASALRTSPGAWVGLSVALVGGTALALGIHQPLLLALRGTMQTIPLGTATLAVSAADLAHLLHAMTVLALALSTPVLLTAAVAELAVRAVSQGPLAATPLASASAPWLRTGAALVALGASWQAYGATWAQATFAVPTL